MNWREVYQLLRENDTLTLRPAMIAALGRYDYIAMFDALSELYNRNRSKTSDAGGYYRGIEQWEAGATRTELLEMVFEMDPRR